MREMLRETVRAGVLILSLLSVPLAPALAHPPAIVSGPAEKAMGEEVADFRKRLAKAVAGKDRAALSALFIDSYRHTHANGRVDGKGSRVALLLSGAPAIETALSHDVVISVPNGWAAVATGRSRLGGRDLRWTVTYVRAGDSWEVAAAQETAITPTR